MPIPHREGLAVDRELKPLCARRAEGGHIDDGQIHRTIEPPLADAHRLREQQASSEHSEADRRRDAELTEAPDTCWDRLRQRRARREAGLEPGAAPMRDESVVESYEQ
ncbi:MAG TPA: DUF2630 family protein [Microbacterium sp.]|nr:DUF2630 family protein [Microbacterium sp.]